MHARRVLPLRRAAAARARAIHSVDPPGGFAPWFPDTGHPSASGSSRAANLARFGDNDAGQQAEPYWTMKALDERDLASPHSRQWTT
jgi:hypothetical protein